ncbi:microtubule-associated proteins 1A/1B light chain 3C-like [Neolamprologus brichardi]|uniref:microtubule-associated proteins 1A/1B light chain 3C-like n=1 Tax=Neolamprologus brichardi TaxID=32507 RepID=UPI001643C829|nr:microtubule-associated proteins 1A/1B light chain 3C-like [Neolamprologus brichardi]
MAPREKSQPHIKPFKLRKSLATRKREVAGIRAKFPNKVPVSARWGSRGPRCPTIVPTDCNVCLSACLGVNKFLWEFPEKAAHQLHMLRTRVALLPSQAFYLLINNSGLASMSLTMAQVYKQYQDEDGFLYMTYASQEMFGR